MKTYRTIQGDTWDAIAYRLTGSETFMTPLIKANPDYINTGIFEAGIMLQIPENEAETSAHLPIWRREEEA